MALKVYTKTGDKGKTSLLGGAKVDKHDNRIAAYGTVDELNAFIGLLRDSILENDQVKGQLLITQENLFTLGSILATDADFKGFELPNVTPQDVDQLEKWIDEFDQELPELKNFILPGGHKTVSLCHVCRTICRRAEREISALPKRKEWEEILPYVNRLSDYFFVLARKLARDVEAEEIAWKPRS